MRGTLRRLRRALAKLGEAFWMKFRPMSPWTALADRRTCLDVDLDFVQREPLRWSALLLRKLYLFFNAAEIPRNIDVYETRAESRLFALLVGPRAFPYPGLFLWPAVALLILCYAHRRSVAIVLAGHGPVGSGSCCGARFGHAVASH